MGREVRQKTQKHFDAVRAWQEDRGPRARRMRALDRLQKLHSLVVHNMGGPGVLKTKTAEAYTETDVARMEREIEILQRKLVIV